MTADEKYMKEALRQAKKAEAEWIVPERIPCTEER